MRQISINEIKTGDLLAPHPDVFLLGDRWVVENVTDDLIEMQIYHCGVRLPNSGWYKCNIDKKTRSTRSLWTRDESLDEWQNYYLTNPEKKHWYDDTLKQVEKIEQII